MKERGGEPTEIGEDLAKTGAVILVAAMALFLFIGTFLSAPFRRR